MNFSLIILHKEAFVPLKLNREINFECEYLLTIILLYQDNLFKINM